MYSALKRGNTYPEFRSENLKGKGILEGTWLVGRAILKS
jgi:hypothetical protein